MTNSCSEEGKLQSVEGGEEGVAMGRREWPCGEGWNCCWEMRDPNLRTIPHEGRRSQGMRLEIELVPGHVGSVCSLGYGYRFLPCFPGSLLCRLYQDVFHLKS